MLIGALVYVFFSILTIVFACLSFGIKGFVFNYFILKFRKKHFSHVHVQVKSSV